MSETDNSQNTDQEETSKEDVAQSGESLDFVLDIPLDVTVKLGSVKMLINDLLQLGQGSIIELSQQVDEPLEIYVSSKLIARGEVVVLDEKFGIRIMDIISPLERVKSLGK